MRFKRLKLLCLVPVAAIVTGCFVHIPIVGLDENGKVIETMVKRNTYINRLTGSMTDMQDSVIPALDSEEGRKLMSMREANLGLHLKGEAGIGEYFKLGGQIGFRFLFANQ